MEIIPDSRDSGQYDSEHPLTLEFKSPKGIVTLHSRAAAGQNAVVVLSSGSKPQSIYATEMDLRDASELVRRYMSINKTQLVVGKIVLVTPIPSTNCLSIHVALPAETGAEEWVVGYMAVDPYHPREVKPVAQSTGQRTSDVTPLTVVSDLNHG